MTDPISERKKISTVGWRVKDKRGLERDGDRWGNEEDDRTDTPVNKPEWL